MFTGCIYIYFMPNQRAEGQKLLPVMASEEFIQALDERLLRAGYSNRSQFVRDAILEKLMRAGIAVPTDLSLSPSRTKPVSYALNDKSGSPFAINDKPSSKLALPVAAAVSYSKDKARRRKPRS
jgi:hypothetical protein